MDAVRQRSPSPQWRRPSQPHRTTLGDTHQARTGSDGLPPIGYLDLDKVKRESSDYDQKHPHTTTINMPAPPLVSPSSMYSGPPPPYSYPSSTASSVGGLTGYISPPDSRRTSDEEKEAPPAQRQSLPSIHEALGKDKSILYNPNLPPNPSSIPTSHPPPAPAAPIPRSHPDPVLSGPPNPYASSQQLPPYAHEATDHPSYPPYRPASSVGSARPRPSIVTAHDSLHQPSQTITPTSPSPKLRTGSHPIPSLPPSTMYPAQAPAPAPGSMTPQPAAYPPYQPAYSYSAHTNGISTYPAPYPSQAWRSDGSEMDRAEEMRKAASKRSPGGGQHYGESVKRHLDIFDLETSLNEIADGSGRALEFSRMYCARSHHTQRSGPLPGSFPTLAECDDMIRRQTRVLDSFNRIQEVIITQQHALAEQRSRDEAHRVQGEYLDDPNGYPDKMDGSGGFAGADPKKRRGRNAPPGRCHSCNRAETPEWRRGPDGARTLCNACGLHYAKLTRKMGSKASSISSSNLRPKESGPGSP